MIKTLDDFPIVHHGLAFPMTRRWFLLNTAVIAGAGLWSASRLDAAPEIPKHRYRIAVCDWMLLKRQKTRALELGKEIGLDGVEVDMGSLGDREDMKNALRSEEVRQQFLDASKKLNVEICSLALSAFYGHSYDKFSRTTFARFAPLK